MRGAVGLLVLCAIVPATARADCESPAPAIVWSYPADGDVDVPANAGLLVLTSIWGPAGEVTIDGVAATRRDDELFAFDLPTLAPGAHTVEVEYGGSAPDAGTTMSFTSVAASRAAPPASPIITGFTLADDADDLSPACRRVVDAMDCHDTGQDTFITLHTDDRPVAWLVTPSSEMGAPFGTELWPSSCGAPRYFFFGGTADHCFTLTAIDEAGQRTTGPTTCPFEEGATSAPAGCAAAAAPAASVMALLVLLRRRRRARSRRA